MQEMIELAKQRNDDAGSYENKHQTNKPTNKPINHPPNQPTNKQTNKQTKIKQTKIIKFDSTIFEEMSFR